MLMVCFAFVNSSKECRLHDFVRTEFPIGYMEGKESYENWRCLLQPILQSMQTVEELRHHVIVCADYKVL